MLLSGTLSAVLLALTPLVAPLPSASAPTGVNYWFSFGDSYSTTAFSTSGAQPSLTNPLGNPAYPGVTGGGGANWVDYRTTANNRSKILTYNYAYGGATIDANLVKPHSPAVHTVIDQVNLFTSTVASKPAAAPWTSNDALFSIWIGINDLQNSYTRPGDREAFSDTLLNAYFGQVQKLYNSGARNFLFINVPPIDRTPIMLAQTAQNQATLKTVVSGYNSKLANKIAAFKAANSGVKTWLWDANPVFTTILNSPTVYGFSDATSYGGAKSFWGNNYHAGAAAHKIFADKVYQLLTGTVW